jgi:hypothetical protein
MHGVYSITKCSSAVSLGELFLVIFHFYECCVYQLRSLRLLDARDRCPVATPFNVSAHRVFGSPLWPTAYLDWSILAELPPHLHLQSMSRCHDILHADFQHSSASSLSLHTTGSIHRPVFRWQVWSSFVSSSVSDRAWAPCNRTEDTHIQWTGIAQSEQWLATGWKVRGSNPGRGEIFPHQSRPALGHTQPPIQWLSGLSRG